MTIAQLLHDAIVLLKTGDNSTPWLDAEVLLANTLKVPREYLIVHAQNQVNNSVIQKINQMIVRRAQGEPIGYIIGEKEFYGLSFHVTPDVLIPRPSTESLIDAVIKEHKTMHGQQVVLIDLGTGSGCIAITLARHNTYDRVIATDISSKALDVARLNAARHKVADLITWLHGDLLSPLINNDFASIFSGNQRLIITANLPYVPSSVVQAKRELAYEPKNALDGGPDGTMLYRQLFTQINEAHEQHIFPLPAALFIEQDDTCNAALQSCPELKVLMNNYIIRNEDALLSLILK